MPRFVVVEQGPEQTAARMTVLASTMDEARKRAEGLGWNVATVAVEGDLSGPATAEQLRAKLTVIEQNLADLSNKPGLGLTWWKIFFACLSAIAVGLAAALFIPK